MIPLVGAAVPAKVPKAPDPLQSREFVPRKLLAFPSVREGVLEEAGIFIAFAVFAIIGNDLFCLFV